MTKVGAPGCLCQDSEHMIVTGPGWDGTRHITKLPKCDLPPNRLFLPLSLSNHNKVSFVEYSLSLALTQISLSNYLNVPLR